MLVAPAALAQDDYKKWEFFGGYSALQFDTLAGNTGSPVVEEVLGGRNTLRGLEVSLVRNFHKYVGAKFDYSLHLREDNFTRPAGSGTVDSTVHNFLGGLQFKDNATEARFKPFAHVLAGVAVQKVDVDSPNLGAVLGITDFSTRETSFSMVFGGGIDIRLNDRIDIRAGQVDLNVVTRGDQQTGIVLAPPPPGQTVGNPFVIPGNTQTNLRLSAGIVIR
jgi:hypothetical protein